METWIIVLIVVVVIALVALFVLLPQMRSRNEARKQEQAREHVQEAQVRSNRADLERAAAQEQVAGAQRERAEAEGRAVAAEREAEQRLAAAREEEARAGRLEERAEGLVPGVTGGSGDRSDDRGIESTYGDRTEPSSDSTYGEGTVADSTRRTDDPGTTRL